MNKVVTWHGLGWLLLGVTSALAGCSGDGGRTGYPDDTRSTSSSTGASGQLSEAHCFADAHTCKCGTSTAARAGMLSVSSCDSSGLNVGCCATRSASGTGYSACYCYDAKAAGGSSLKCMSTTESVSSCDSLSYTVPSSSGAASSGCNADYDCIGTCVGETYACSAGSCVCH